MDLIHMDLNKFAKEITLSESGKVSLGIGQVKEVLRITLTKLGDYEDKEVIKTVNRYRKK